jgi:hypothetical protein
MPGKRASYTLPKIVNHKGTNLKVALQLYYITKAELELKKQAKLPKSDRRRLIIQRNHEASALRRLISKTAVDIVSLKRSFMTAFASLQLKMNSFL